MIIITQKGSFKNTERFLTKASRAQYLPILEKYAQEGLVALRSATPVATGLTSRSWSYKITVTKTGFTINWNNDNVQSGVPIAIILQYGHATKNGGFVEGVDYINPAVRPIFEKIAAEAWREVGV